MMSDLAARLQAALGDSYRIERELGGGGMSRLFVAEEASLHRRVVVKVLPPQFASEVSAARFRQEVELAARLQHPNILPVLAAGTRDDLLYYIIPYVPGESLRHRLTREGQLPLPDALEILREVADALAYAHSEGILHRDIKPENVLLMGRHASLTDFGVARALSEARTGEQLTETGLAVGTPGYMAPEQAAGERHIDARADVYALAVVGYEMLTGKPPFEGPTAQAVLAAHLTSTPKPLSAIRPEVPARVSQLIARALHKTPADRLGTAAELRDGLMVELPVAGARWRRHVWWAAAVVGLVLIGAGLARFTRSTRPNRVDANLLAVAPFDAVSPSVKEYREGVLTILSRSLDGAGPIRTVSPSVVVRRWTGESDPSSASALGRGTGAGLVVFGQVVPAGADSVRLSATIYDVQRGRSLAEVEVRDEQQRIDRIVDTLAVRLLREVGRTRPVGAVRFASLGSTSLPAIKLFLAAEQFYRRGQWDSTVVYAQRATAVDSDFTLALRRIPNALWWSNADVAPMQLRAGARNHGLAPRESLLVTMDSLWGALDSDLLPHWPLVRRLSATARETVKRYPEDPEAWYMLGETAYHYGGQVAPRVSPRAAFDAFARAVEFDSAFAPAYEHIPNLALRLRDSAMARRYAQAYIRIGAGGASAASVSAALDLLASPKAPPPATVAFLDTATSKQLWDTWIVIKNAADSGEAAVAAARAFTRSRHRTDSVDVERQRGVLAQTLAFRGHLREATHELWARRGAKSELASMFTAADLITLGAVSPDSAAAWLESLLQDSSAWSPVGLAWWSARGDSISIRRLERVARSKSRSSPAGTAEAAYWTYQTLAVQPYVALTHGDTSLALTLFAGLPDSLCRYCYLQRLKRAQLLSGKQEEELAALLKEPLHDHDFITPSEVLWALEQARVRERTGDRESAADAYAFVAAAWQHADEELQPLVREAKEALARLNAEPRP
jgi:eukaryotic-like serine/threonine-protein kinase